MKFPTDWSMYGFCRQNLGQGEGCHTPRRHGPDSIAWGWAWGRKDEGCPSSVVLSWVFHSQRV